MAGLPPQVLERGTDAPFSVACARACLRSAAILLALWSVLAQACLLAGVSFDALCGTYGVFLVLLVLATGAARLRRERTGPPRDGSVAAGLTLLALAGTVVALVAIQPNLDDVGYVSRPLWFLEHPGAALDLAYHDQALAPWPTEYPLMLASTVELLWAWVAWLTGLEYLTVYHRLVPALGGFLLPLAWFVLVHAFVRSSPRALFGTALIVAFLLLDGTTVRSFGNSAFVRIWQGKILLLAVLLPAYLARVVAWLLDSRRPRARAWIELAVWNAAASGLSGTALVFLPILAGLLSIAALAARGFSRATLTRVALFLASLGWSMSLAVYLWVRTRDQDFTHIGFEKFPDSFRGQFELVFGQGLPVVALLLAASSALAVVVTRGARRRLLLAWALAAALLVLNPVAMPIVSRLTTNNTYWRLFMAYPFPLALGLVGAALPLRERGSLAASVLLVGAALGACARWPGHTAFGQAEHALGRNKIDAELEQDARAILAACREGPMLAPQPISTLVPMFTSSVPQVCVRSWFVMHFGIQSGMRELAESRKNAWMFLSGMRPDGIEDLAALLTPELESLVLFAPMARDPRMRTLVEGRGYREALARGDYVLYTRSEP